MMEGEEGPGSPAQYSSPLGSRATTARHDEMKTKSLTRDIYSRLLGALPAGTSVFNEFCENTSLHGWQFIVKTDRHKVVNFFWIIVTLLSIAGSIYLISVGLLELWYWGLETIALLNG